LAGRGDASGEAVWAGARGGFAGFGSTDFRFAGLLAIDGDLFFGSKRLRAFCLGRNCVHQRGLSRMKACQTSSVMPPFSWLQAMQDHTHFVPPR
jgi:hypothetical protein